MGKGPERVMGVMVLIRGEKSESEGGESGGGGGYVERRVSVMMTMMRGGRGEERRGEERREIRTEMVREHTFRCGRETCCRR